MARVQREMKATWVRLVCTTTCTNLSTHPHRVTPQEELNEAQIPLAWRDYCADLLIPLNKCRRANFWWPSSCEHEKHAYEKCQYLDYKARVEAVKKERQASSS